MWRGVLVILAPGPPERLRTWVRTTSPSISVGYCEQPLESDTYLEYGATAAYYGHGSGGGRHSSDSGESSHAVMSRAHFAADLAAGEATSPSRVARSAAAGRGSADSSYLSAVVKGVKRQREDRDCGAGASADSHHLASEDSHSVKLTREERENSGERHTSRHVRVWAR